MGVNREGVSEIIYANGSRVGPIFEILAALAALRAKVMGGRDLEPRVALTSCEQPWA